MHTNRYPGGVVYFPFLEERTVLTHAENVDVVWMAEPMFSEIISTRLSVRGPMQLYTFRYDSIRRRLYYGRYGEA